MALTRIVPRNIAAAIQRKLDEAPGVGAAPQAAPQLPTGVVLAPVAALDTTYTLVAGDGSLQILPQRDNRQYLLLVNVGSNPVWVSFGKNAASGIGLLLPANGYYEPLRPITSSVNALSPLGSVLTAVEG